MDFDIGFQRLFWACKSFRQVNLNPLWIRSGGNQVGKLFGRLLIEHCFATFGGVQVFDQAFHTIVDAADPNAALIAIQSQHHRFVVVNRSHEVVGIIPQRNDLNFALIDARFVNVFVFVDSNFDRTLFDPNGCLEFVVQCQMRMVFKQLQAFANNTRRLASIGFLGGLQQQDQHAVRWVNQGRFLNRI